MRDSEIAGQCEVEAAAERGAVQRRDDRHRCARDRLHPSVQRAIDHLGHLGRPAGERFCRHRGIGAGTEHRAAAGDDDGANIVVDAIDGRGGCRGEIDGERVVLRGPVDRQPQCVCATLDSQIGGVLDHLRALLVFGPRCATVRHTYVHRELGARHSVPASATIRRPLTNVGRSRTRCRIGVCAPPRQQAD